MHAVATSLLLLTGVLVGTGVPTAAAHAATATAGSPAAGGASPAADRAARAAATKTIYVDPRRGSDRRKGTKRAPMKSLDAAWRAARSGTTIRIKAGKVRVGATYYEAKDGVRIVGAGMAKTTVPPLNIYGVKNFTLSGVTVDGDVHCEACDGFTLDGVRVDGRGRIQEGVKVNQSRRVLITRSDISGATDNAIDFVAVQDGTIAANDIHHAEDWCAYAKGGSAYIRVYGNRIHDCGTGGFVAGQGTGLQFMQAPWLRYEAYDVRVWNNLITNTDGAGLGANGAYGALFARNTLIGVGSRSHALEAVYGLRSCDGQPGDEGRERCAGYLAQGAWGTTRVDDGTNAVRIPNRHVWFVDNVIVKARGSDTISVAGPWDDPSQDGSGVPRPALADDDLQLIGNVVTEDVPGVGPPSALPDLVWEDAAIPAPATLSNVALPGMPATAGSSLSIR
ncbi:MAG: right-handed parallel beta-helix repeat-containing protein [Solirubrobacteraceae bacterium]|nr:right-handed parallel beta-helix repeat-containing protein [Solirubrobacteraceae bacterium]